MSFIWISFFLYIHDCQIASLYVLLACTFCDTILTAAVAAVARTIENQQKTLNQKHENETLALSFEDSDVLQSATKTSNFSSPVSSTRLNAIISNFDWVSFLIDLLKGDKCVFFSSETILEIKLKFQSFSFSIRHSTVHTLDNICPVWIFENKFFAPTQNSSEWTKIKFNWIRISSNMWIGSNFENSSKILLQKVGRSMKKFLCAIFWYFLNATRPCEILAIDSVSSCVNNSSTQFNNYHVELDLHCDLLLAKVIDCCNWLPFVDDLIKFN